MTWLQNDERRLAGYGRRSEARDLSGNGSNFEITGSARVQNLRAYCKTIAARSFNEGSRHVGSCR